MLPAPSEIYRHFKGNQYEIITIAEDTETGDSLVIYKALYGEGKVYARELGMFQSEVDHEKYPNVAQKYRFEKIGEAAKVLEPGKGDGLSASESCNLSENAVTEENTVSMNTKAPALDPLLEKYLDATTYEDRLELLNALHHRITDDMLTTMAVVSDIEIPDGSTEERYNSLKSCLLTLTKYECNRLR